MSQTPVRVMQTFMDTVDGTKGQGHVDYAVNAPMKNDGIGVVTVLEGAPFSGRHGQPFICMIDCR